MKTTRNIDDILDEYRQNADMAWSEVEDKVYTVSEYHKNAHPKIMATAKQQLLSTIKAGLPEKYTQTEMMAGIDDSADYRDGYNQALKAVEDYLDSLFGGSDEK